MLSCEHRIVWNVLPDVFELFEFEYNYTQVSTIDYLFELALYIDIDERAHISVQHNRDVLESEIVPHSSVARHGSTLSYSCLLLL